MSNVERLLNTEAKNQVESDRLVNDRLPQISGRVEVLLANPEERNLAIWDLFEVAAPEATLADYAAVEVKDRDLAWSNELATMIAAAKYQAWAELVASDMLSLWERHGESIQAVTQGMSKGELQTAAKQGVGKARRDEAKR